MKFFQFKKRLVNEVFYYERKRFDHSTEQLRVLFHSAATAENFLLHIVEISTYHKKEAEKVAVKIYAQGIGEGIPREFNFPYIYESDCSFVPPAGMPLIKPRTIQYAYQIPISRSDFTDIGFKLVSRYLTNEDIDAMTNSAKPEHERWDILTKDNTYELMRKWSIHPIPKKSL